MQHGSLPEFVASSLAAHAGPLARHWLERAAAATPRAASVAAQSAAAPADVSTPAAGVRAAEQVVQAVAARVRRVTWPAAPGDAATNSPAVAAAAVQDARPTAEVMRLGWAAGRAAYEAGHSVHHVARDADLLLAVLLAEVERTVAACPPGPGYGAADGVAVARQLQRAVGRYGHAALSGFVHALLRGLRERYRLLRHDLRNPLGTIRSALSLMEDESVPVETRQGPGVRAMVARNAGSLDRLIGRRLDDAAAAALLAPPSTVHVRDIALAARREVRAAARLAGCDVAVEVPADVPALVDAAALEMTLTTLVLAALTRATAGDVVRIACAPVERGADAGAAPPGRACGVLRLTIEHADGRLPCTAVEPGAEPADVLAGGTPCWDEQGLALALALAHDYGVRLGSDPHVEPAGDVAALAAALARGPVVYLRLPFIEEPPAVAGASVAPADAALAVPTRSLAR